jgi:hypothetical protein
MMKKSTLMYFVKQFNSDSESISFDTDDEYERTLTRMGKNEKLPSDRTIKKILNFARSYEVLETKETGYVEMILN